MSNRDDTWQRVTAALGFSEQRLDGGE